MLEKRKSCNDKGKSFRALMVDLSKAFDCLSHELITTKLHAYGFNQQALKFMNSYLSERKQNKIRCSLQFLERNYLSVNLKDIEFASYAGDNTSYTEHGSIGQVISRLEGTAESLFKWFSDNQMKANLDKSHFL